MTDGDLAVNRTQGETEGPEQEPTQAGDQDPAIRAPRADGPMVQPADAEQANDEMATSPDAAHGRREGQADSDSDPDSAL